MTKQELKDLLQHAEKLLLMAGNSLHGKIDSKSGEEIDPQATEYFIDAMEYFYKGVKCYSEARDDSLYEGKIKETYDKRFDALIDMYHEQTEGFITPYHRYPKTRRGKSEGKK